MTSPLRDLLKFIFFMTERLATYTVNYQIVKPFLARVRPIRRPF